jgi:hypothetical protein
MCGSSGFSSFSFFSSFLGSGMVMGSVGIVVFVRFAVACYDFLCVVLVTHFEREGFRLIAVARRRFGITKCERLFVIGGKVL